MAVNMIFAICSPPPTFARQRLLRSFRRRERGHCCWSAESTHAHQSCPKLGVWGPNAGPAYGGLLILCSDASSAGDASNAGSWLLGAQMTSSAAGVCSYMTIRASSNSRYSACFRQTRGFQVRLEVPNTCKQATFTPASPWLLKGSEVGFSLPIRHFRADVRIHSAKDDHPLK